MMQISKTILITGGLSDIGRVVAQTFAREGYAVALNYRHDPHEAEAFTSSLIQDWKAPHAIACQGDIRSRKETAKLFDRVYEAFGRLDVLINNAGINRDKAFIF